MSVDDSLKAEGNQLFASGKYGKALVKYTQAIEVDDSNAIYFANRAFCHIKLENFGEAIIDASRAIELNPAYVKGYYRRASAYLALGKFKAAVLDFKHVVTIAPNNKKAKLQLSACKKAATEAAFAAAIESDHSRDPSEIVNYTTMSYPVSYNGPSLEDETPISLGFVDEVIDAFMKQETLPLKLVYRILIESVEVFKATKTLMRIPIPDSGVFTVCGDTHGQFYDLLNIFTLTGKPSHDNPILFNGDFVDRGSFSTENILTLLLFKLASPTGTFLTRGNHESLNMNQMYGFQGEVLQKYDKTTFDLFTQVFDLLPLCAVIDNAVFVTHGGLFSQDGVTLSDIENVNRNRQPPDSGLMCELLWSDPMPQPGRAPSKRGVGCSFGPDVTHNFLTVNGLKMVVRSHEVKDEGFEVVHDGKLVTIFSAPNYCDQMGNRGAYIRFDSNCTPTYHKFDAVEHPNIPPMAYAKPMFGF